MANLWENPSVYGEHKIKPHVPLRSYETVDQIFEYYTTLPDGSTSGRCQSLDGPWKFALFSSPETVPLEFCQHQYDDSVWCDVCRCLSMSCQDCCSMTLYTIIVGRGARCLGDAGAWNPTIFEL